MKQKLIIVVGLTGSGKSTVARVIANQLGSCFIDKDTVTKKFTERFMEATYHDPNDRESEFYMRNIRPVQYEVLFDIVRENLEIENNVTMTATFLEEVKDPLFIEKLVKKYPKSFENVSIFVVFIKSNRNIEKERLLRRSATKDNWKLKNWDSYSRSVSDYNISWRMGPFQLKEFDNSHNDRSLMETELTNIIAWVNASR